MISSGIDGMRTWVVVVASSREEVSVRHPVKSEYEDEINANKSNVT